jgi:thiosulfate dehydrogenase [quinone] large subunit
MLSAQKFSLLFLRLMLGWYFFYAGVSKLLDPAWSAAGYISSSKVFPGFYHMLLSPGLLPIVNLFNEWGLTLLGLALIFGLFVRLGSFLGIIVMILYYLPVFHFPYVGDHAFIVDEHIIYIAAMMVLVSFHSSNIRGFGRFTKRLGAWAQ